MLKSSSLKLRSVFNGELSCEPSSMLICYSMISIA
jgi:hypothetical protein